LSFKIGPGMGSSTIPNENATMPNATRIRAKVEKQMMSEIEMSAKNELLKLACTNYPIWVKSPFDRRYVLHNERYLRLFARLNLIKDFNGHVESSKDSQVVKINAIALIQMVLNSVCT
jgi:homeobox-leucine zipper protein